MSNVAIFLYGLVVFAIVATAAWLLVWGIYREREDRRERDANVEGPAPVGQRTATGGGGETISTPRR